MKWNEETSAKIKWEFNKNKTTTRNHKRRRNKNLELKNTKMAEFDRELQKQSNDAEERIGELDRSFEIIQ